MLPHAIRFRASPSFSWIRRAACDSPLVFTRQATLFARFEPATFIRIFLAFGPRGVRPVIILSNYFIYCNTGGYEPPFFRERGAFPLCSGNANPLRFPPQRKGGSPKISAFLEKRGNGPKVGLVPGMTKPPTPQKCPFPLRVPTFVPGLLRPRFCSPFWFPLPFLVSLGAVCSGFRSPNEKTHNFGAPRGGYRKKPLFSVVISANYGPSCGFA